MSSSFLLQRQSTDFYSCFMQRLHFKSRGQEIDWVHACMAVLLKQESFQAYSKDNVNDNGKFIDFQKTENELWS